MTFDFFSPSSLILLMTSVSTLSRGAWAREEVAPPSDRAKTRVGMRQRRMAYSTSVDNGAWRWEKFRQQQRELCSPPPRAASSFCTNRGTRLHPAGKL